MKTEKYQRIPVLQANRIPSVASICENVASCANALVGKYVIIKTTSSTGETTATQGFVDYVQKENGEQKICVNGVLYSLSDVYQVADTEYKEAETLAKTFAAAVAKLPSAAQLTLSENVASCATYSVLLVGSNGS